MLSAFLGLFRYVFNLAIVPLLEAPVTDLAVHGMPDVVDRVGQKAARLFADLAGIPAIPVNGIDLHLVETLRQGVDRPGTRGVKPVHLLNHGYTVCDARR